MEINFGGQTFELLKEGAVYWPAQKALIVSDLHLEKGSSFLTMGVFLPPYDSHATLEKLCAVVDRIAPETIIFLGDVFHDKGGEGRLFAHTRDCYHKLIREHKIIWIEGNHDPDSAPEGITGVSEKDIENIMLRHIATEYEQDLPEISGHYHPAVRFVYKGQKIRRPCFIINEDKMILPSFGAYTGGLDITEGVINKAMGAPFHAYITGPKKVLKLNGSFLPKKHTLSSSR